MAQDMTSKVFRVKTPSGAAGKIRQQLWSSPIFVFSHASGPWTAPGIQNAAGAAGAGAFQNPAEFEALDTNGRRGAPDGKRR